MLYRSTRDTSQPPHLLSFEETVLAGLAPDGGLYIPTHIPDLQLGDPVVFRHWSTVDFCGLCLRLFRAFIDPRELSDDQLRSLIHQSYATTFSHPLQTPLVELSTAHTKRTNNHQQLHQQSKQQQPSQEESQSRLFLLELFHGPTFAFKDVALQFLGNLFEFFLKRKNKLAQAIHNNHSNNDNADNNEKRISGEDGVHRLTVVGATSGDTGGAAIYGLRNKGKRIRSSIIMHNNAIYL